MAQVYPPGPPPIIVASSVSFMSVWTRFKILGNKHFN